MLSIQVSVGSHIEIENHTLRVKSIGPPNHIVVIVDGQEHLLTDETRKEIVPGVKVQVGSESNRLAFDAPKSIKISRIEGGVPWNARQKSSA